MSRHGGQTRTVEPDVAREALLVVVSKHDRTTSPEPERVLAGRMNATTVEIDSGHLSMITHPDRRRDR